MDSERFGTGDTLLAAMQSAWRPDCIVPQQAQGGRVRGGAGGAAAGAAMGAIAGDAGKGAAMSAVGGAMIGGARQRQQNRANSQQ
ncbi:hypothetical protein BHUM_01024, partial [Candidatus Burkholderia humilis]